MRLVPKNWREFQHYQDRRPPWIKLHRKLLDDSAFLRLPVASRALAPCLWLLASESDGGEFEAGVDELEFRLRLPRKELADGIKGLVEAGFLIAADGADASTPLAECLHAATESVSLSVSVSERESTRGRTAETPEGFEEFWTAYGKAVDRRAAVRAWLRIDPDEALRIAILESARLYAAATPDKQFRKHPATWLNAEGWNNEVVQPAAVMPNGKPARPVTHYPNMPLGVPSCNCADCVAFRAKKQGAAS